MKTILILTILLLAPLAVLQAADSLHRQGTGAWLGGYGHTRLCGWCLGERSATCVCSTGADSSQRQLEDYTDSAGGFLAERGQS
jgi:hypothetical protein